MRCSSAYAMQLCHYNFSCYMYDGHYMNHSHRLHFMSITMQTYIANIQVPYISCYYIYKYHIMHISIHQSMTKQMMSYSLPYANSWQFLPNTIAYNMSCNGHVKNSAIHIDTTLQPIHLVKNIDFIKVTITHYPP